MDHPSSGVLWRYANAALPVGRRRGVREHALACERCRTELSRAIVARRALGGGEDLLLPRAADVAAWSAEVTTQIAPEHSPLRLWAAALAVATVAGLSLVLLVPGADEDLSARGAQPAPPVFLRALCVIQPPGQPVLVHDASARPCPVGGFLKLLVGNAGSLRTRYSVVGVQGGVWHLYPGAAGESLSRLPNEQQALEGSFLLDAARAGRLRVVVLAVDEERLAAEDGLWAWVSSAAPGGYRDLLGRADATVLEITVSGGNR